MHQFLDWPFIITKRRCSVQTFGVERSFSKIWSIREPWRLISLGKGYYHIMLGSQATKRRIWQRGTLGLKPGIFRIQPTQPDFDPALQKTTKAIVWVHLHGLPWGYWDPTILACFAKGIGEFSQVDSATLDRDYGHFARIAVDVDLASSLPSKIGVEKEDKQIWVDLEYENLPDFCKICSSIGHAWRDCRRNKGMEAMNKEDKIIKDPNISRDCPQAHEWQKVGSRKNKG